MKPTFARLSLAATLLILAASCVPAPPPATIVPPSGAPSASPISPAAVATPTPGPTPTATGTAMPAGVFFRETFDTELDPARWTVFERGSVVRVKDGMLDIVVGGQTKEHPYVITAREIVPQQGPFYLELRYKFLSAGLAPCFYIDYLPPASPEDTPLTEPLLATNSSPLNTSNRPNMTVTLRTETGAKDYVVPNGLATEKEHRLRLEYDAAREYRVIVDDAEVARRTSERRPLRFWIGQPKGVPLRAVTWTRLNIDLLETGLLTTPDPATPAPTPTPRPSATESPAASPTPTPTPRP